MADQLKACAHCGGKAEFDCDDDGYHWIFCTKCSISTDTARHAEDDCHIELAATWNTRAEPVGVPTGDLSTTVQAGDVRNATLEFAAENFEALVISRDEIFKAGYVIDTLRFLKSAAPSQPVAGQITQGLIATMSRIIDCVEILDKRPRPFCRDCADECGICPNDKLNCDMRALIKSGRELLTTANAGKDAK